MATIDHQYDLVAEAIAHPTGRFRRFPRGSTIVRQGDDATHFHVVAEGGARAYHDSEDGKRYSVAAFCPGSFFGENALIVNARRSLTVVATEDTATISFGRTTLLKWIEKDHKLSVYLNVVLAERIIILGTREIQSRLAPLRVRLLDHLHGMIQGSHRRPLKVAPQILAEDLGVSTRSIYRTLRELEAGGSITRSCGVVSLARGFRGEIE